MKLQFCKFKCKYFREAGDFYLVKFQKSTKKLEFAALLKHFFDFVPRGINALNFQAGFRTY